MSYRMKIEAVVPYPVSGDIALLGQHGGKAVEQIR